MFRRFGWGKLRAKIIAWSFVPTAIILTAVALVGFYAYQQVTETLTIQSSRELARLSAGQLAAELTDYSRTLTTLAYTADLYDNNPDVQRAALKQASNRLMLFDGGVVILNNYGIVTAAEPERPEIIGQDWSNRVYFRQMAASPGTVFSDIVGDGAQGTPVVVAAVPIINNRGEFMGAMVGMFRVGANSLSPFYGSIVRLRIGVNDAAFLVDRNGLVLYHTDDSQIGQNMSAQPVVQQVINGKADALRTHDPSGREIVAAFAPVPGTPWGLVTEEGWDALLAPGQRYIQSLFLLLVLGLVIPAVVVTFGVRKITQPINQLIAATKNVANRDFAKSISVQTGDELEELGNHFNLMSAQLAESYATLRASEERFALVVQGTNDGIWDWDLITNDVYYSPRWKKMLGYTDGELPNRLETWRKLLHPDDAERALAELDAYLAGRTSAYRVEVRMRCKDGTYRWISTRGGALRDAQGKAYRMAGSHTDITERKHAERALQDRLTLEKLITDISTEFINLGPDEVDAGIRHALQAIAEYAGGDRSYVFRFSEDGAVMDNTHEWCAGDIEPQINRRQGILADTLPYLTGRIKRLEVLYVPRLADLPPEAQREKSVFETEKIRSLICVPMVYRGAAVGFLGFDAVRAEKKWSGDAVTLLTIVGEIFVNALEHQRASAALQQAYQTLERRVEERTHALATLNAIAASVSRSLDLKKILSNALDQTMEITEMEVGAAYRLDEASQTLILMVQRGESAEFVERTARLPLQVVLGGQTIREDQPIVFEVQDYPEGAIKSLLRNEGLQLIVGVPLMAKGRLTGGLVMSTRTPRTLAAEETSLLMSIGRQIGMAVENARLYEQAEQSAAFAERSRLARELHDSVTQSLYSVTLHAEAAVRWLTAGDQAQAADYLRDLRDTAQEALREMRLLIFELRPPELEKTGLAAALQARLDGVEVRGGMKADLQVIGEEHLPPRVQDELYHIAREALNNALKHSRASRVQVRLQFLDTCASLEVCDDGVGFDAARVDARRKSAAAWKLTARRAGGRMSRFKSRRVPEILEAI